MFKTKYRIVTDAYLGYEVQFRVWFFPFYLQCNGSNTHPSLEAAKAYLGKQKTKIVYSE